MATSKDYPLGEYTFPRGWFMIADAQEPNEHKPLAVRFFGKDFALYRGHASGEVVLLHAYCLHMKTHAAARSTTFMWCTAPAMLTATASATIFHTKATRSRSQATSRVGLWSKTWGRFVLGITLREANLSVDRYENEFKGHTVPHIQCDGHRTLTAADESGAIFHTDTSHHGPGVLIFYLTSMFETLLPITHTPVDGGTLKVWHSLIVKSPECNAVSTTSDLVTARKYQESSRLAFAQDFEVWTNKGPCLNGPFIPSDDPLMNVQICYKQFYNPLAKKNDYLEQCEEIYMPRGSVAYIQPSSEFIL